MIQINKEYVNPVRKMFPNITIKRTVHKYYIEEDKDVLNFLNLISQRNIKLRT